MTDFATLLPVTLLLPITALLLVAQGNPYQTLVLRGILGTIAALLYALLGAADVALTEALVGTLLSTMLYLIALRSSMVLRLGVLSAQPLAGPQLEALQGLLGRRFLRLQQVTFGDESELGGALARAELHGALLPGGHLRLRGRHLLTMLEPLHSLPAPLALRCELATVSAGELSADADA